MKGSIMRFDPFAEMDRMTRDLWTTRGGFMATDAYRVDDKFHVNLDVPGVDPESIDITLEDGTLTVAVERTLSRDSDAQLKISERPSGTFTREFTLGDGLDQDNIEADYDHGVLTITIPVAERAKPRKITVGATAGALTS